MDNIQKLRDDLREQNHPMQYMGNFIINHSNSPDYIIEMLETYLQAAKTDAEAKKNMSQCRTKKTMNNVNIQPTRLFTMRDDLIHEEKVICLAFIGIQPGEILWLDGSRPSSLGGYIGNFQKTYKQVNGYSPNGKELKNIPMNYLKEV